MERRLGQWENMREGRSTLSSCGVGEENWEYRGWRERQTSIIENIKSEWTLESRVTKAALSYFGHVVREGGMEDDVMLGRMNWARKRGRPKQRWLDTLKGYASWATISNMRRDTRDRAGWRGAATGSDATRRHRVTGWQHFLVLLKYRPSECRLGGMSSNWISAPLNRLGDCRLTECRLSDRYPSEATTLCNASKESNRIVNIIKSVHSYRVLFFCDPFALLKEYFGNADISLYLKKKAS